MLQLKRAYEPKSPADGRRILVDRLWPNDAVVLAAIVRRRMARAVKPKRATKT
jgi:hypothetical protein